ncbi:15097_t:CDS:2, partial [Racocetra persica]
MTKINITIDGQTALGKSSMGKLLAERLNYQFIDKENILTQINQIDSKELISNEFLIKISNNNNIREAINKVIREITKQKGYIVVVNRRVFQFNIKEFNNIWLDIIKRDLASSDLIEKAKKISQNIDTTYLILSE